MVKEVFPPNYTQTNPQPSSNIVAGSAMGKLFEGNPLSVFASPSGIQDVADEFPW
jgi:hypothetical protein